MAQINFGGVEENVVTREEFPLKKALEVLKDETIAIIGYGVQGPGQSLNLRDNGFNVIVGQRKGSKSWDKAVADGWVPGETLFGIEEAAERATIIQYLLSDAGQIAVWPTIKKHLTPGKALYFSHGFGITYKERTGIVPPADVDVILIAPKGSGTSLRRMFLQGRGLNSSYAVFQDATGRAFERVVGAVLADAGSSYGIELSRKVAFLLAQEICLQLWPGIGLAKRKSACAEQISHLLGAVTSELPFASSVSDQVAADVEGALGISLDHFTKTLLTLCVASESRDAKALRTLCVILSHGYSTATSIADAANRMLGMHVYEAVDMPYDQQLKDIVGRSSASSTAIPTAPGSCSSSTWAPWRRPIRPSRTLPTPLSAW